MGNLKAGNILAGHLTGHMLSRLNNTWLETYWSDFFTRIPKKKSCMQAFLLPLGNTTIYPLPIHLRIKLSFLLYKFQFLLLVTCLSLLSNAVAKSNCDGCEQVDYECEFGANGCGKQAEECGAQCCQSSFSW